VNVSAQSSSVSSEIPAVTNSRISIGGITSPFGHNRLLVNLEWIVEGKLTLSSSGRTVSNTGPGNTIGELGKSTSSDGRGTINSNFSSIRWDSNWDFEFHFNGGWDIEFSTNGVTNTSGKGSTVVLNEDGVSTSTGGGTDLGVSWATRHESFRGRGSVIVLNVTIGVRVSTYTEVSVGSKMWVETPGNKVGDGSGGGFLGDFELGGLLGTSGDDVTSVSFKKSVVNGSRTELVSWVGNSNIEFHEESRPISRSKILIGNIDNEGTRNSINGTSWLKSGHLGSFFGEGISRGGTELLVGTLSTPSPTFIGDWVSLPGVGTGGSSSRSKSGTVSTKSQRDLVWSSNVSTFSERESHGEGDSVTSSGVSLVGISRVWGSSKRHGGWWSSDGESRVEDHIGIDNWTFDTSSSRGSHGGDQSSLETNGSERTSFGSSGTNLNTVGSTSGKRGGSTKSTGTNSRGDGKSTGHPRSG